MLRCLAEGQIAHVRPEKVPEAVSIPRRIAVEQDQASQVDLFDRTAAWRSGVALPKENVRPFWRTWYGRSLNNGI
jgi:hypothetical protein